MFAALGALFLGMGLLSCVLPQIGVRFQLVALVERIHPNAPPLFIVGGTILMVLGLMFDRRSPRASAKVLNALAQWDRDEAETQEDERRRSPLPALLLLVLLGAGGYYLHNKYKVFNPLVEAVQKEWKEISTNLSAQQAKDGGSDKKSSQAETQKSATRTSSNQHHAKAGRDDWGKLMSKS
jgi:hypothetical protein